MLVSAPLAGLCRHSCTSDPQEQEDLQLHLLEVKLNGQDGERCKNPVNRTKCAYCNQHVQSELKKVSSGRAQLRGNSLKSAFRGGMTKANG